jgi:hypothetical protein
VLRGEPDEWREHGPAPAPDMDVERKRPADWPHWPDRGSGPTRRDRLERRLFQDSEREAEIERAQATIRQIERMAAAKAAQVERLEQAVQRVNGTPAPAATTFLALVSAPSGYSLRALEGDAPERGGSITVDGVEHLVAKVGRSPLPGDTRRCAYLDPS